MSYQTPQVKFGGYHSKTWSLIAIEKLKVEFKFKLFYKGPTALELSFGIVEVNFDPKQRRVLLRLVTTSKDSCFRSIAIGLVILALNDDRKYSPALRPESFFRFPGSSRCRPDVQTCSPPQPCSLARSRSGSCRKMQHVNWPLQFWIRSAGQRGCCGAVLLEATAFGALRTRFKTQSR